MLSWLLKTNNPCAIARGPDKVFFLILIDLFRHWKGLWRLFGSFSYPGEHPQPSQPDSRAEVLQSLEHLDGSRWISHPWNLQVLLINLLLIPSTHRFLWCWVCPITSFKGKFRLTIIHSSPSSACSWLWELQLSVFHCAAQGSVFHLKT